MNTCEVCNKETENPKFCSRSCSAKQNNRLHPKRVKTVKFCKRCNREVQRNSYCNDCFRIHKTERRCKIKFLGKFITEYVKEKSIYNGMIGRCHNKNHAHYHQYGAKGITVCESWKQSFLQFLIDVGPIPNQSLTLDRINGKIGYEPGNVRWATRLEQSRNRDNRRIGDFNSIAELAEYLGMEYGTLLSRVNRGWTLERILSTPTHKRKYKNKQEKVL